MTVQESIYRLIDSAKRLRAVAESLDMTDVREQVTEELLRLHDLRDAVPDAPVPAPAAQAAGHAAAVQTLLAGDQSKMFEFETAEGIEPYSLAAESDEDEPASTAGAAVAGSKPGGRAPADEAVAATVAEANKNGGPVSTAGSRPAKSPAVAVDSPADSGETGKHLKSRTNAGPDEADLSEDERFARAERQIQDLEPLHRAALRQMNDILTEEQRQRKAEATRAGMKAGIKGRELQQAVLDSLELTAVQQQKMAAARKELQDVLHAISSQVEDLLTKEQLNRLLHRMGRNAQ